MAQNLLQTLNENAHRSPDQIVARLSDPFPEWAQGDAVTAELYRLHGRLRIVICSETYRDNPEGWIEPDHAIGAQVMTDEGYHTHHWRLNDWHNGTLRPGSQFWFRSRKSYDANPDQGF